MLRSYFLVNKKAVPERTAFLFFIDNNQQNPAGPCYPTEETLLTQGGVLFAALCYQRPIHSGLCRLNVRGAGGSGGLHTCVRKLFSDSNF